MNCERLLDESLIPLSRVGELFPGARQAKRINPSTAHRWSRKGARGADGRRVVLESIRVGGRVMSSREAVLRFVTALTGSAGDTGIAVRTPAERAQASRVADAELERLGA